MSRTSYLSTNNNQNGSGFTTALHTRVQFRVFDRVLRIESLKIPGVNF